MTHIPDPAQPGPGPEEPVLAGPGRRVVGIGRAGPGAAGQCRTEPGQDDFFCSPAD